MKVIHVSAWAKMFTQFRMPMIRALRDLAERQVIYCPDQDSHYDRLVADGYEFVTAPVSKGFSLSVISEIRRLTRFLRQEPYDVLIAHQPMGALVGITAAHRAGVPAKIYSTGGLKYVPDAGGIANRLIKHGEVRIMNRSDAVLLVNREDEATLRSLPIDPTTIHYVGPRGGCGIDARAFNPSEREHFYARSRRELGLLPEQTVVGFVGRCVWEKGLRELAEAAAILARIPDNQHLRFCILGDGGDLDAFKDFVATLGVAEMFVFPGYLPDIHRYVAAFDIFVLPSYREGLPISLLEAQAMGIPSIATNIRGSRELVEDRVTGLLVACKDPNGLADALQTLVADKEIANRLGTAGAENVLNNYSEATLVPRMIDIIQLTLETATRSETTQP